MQVSWAKVMYRCDDHLPIQVYPVSLSLPSLSLPLSLSVPLSLECSSILCGYCHEWFQVQQLFSDGRQLLRSLSCCHHWNTELHIWLSLSCYSGIICTLIKFKPKQLTVNIRLPMLITTLTSALKFNYS